MRIAIPTSHLYGLGGGFSAVWWHSSALRDLGHSVTVLTMNQPHPIVLRNWIPGVSIAWYAAGVEREFDATICINHFGWVQPLSAQNYAHVFFPTDDIGPPPDGVKLFANSQYTASHIKYKWGRDAEVMYIPIKSIFKPLPKERIILHVSRISEPSPWADKGHRQMIEAFRMYHRELPGWELVFCGSVDPRQDAYMGELMQMGRGLNIRFVLDATDEQIADWYGRAAIYWHCTGSTLPTIPSAQEHFGLAPLEAQAAGCVPLVYNSGGMPEVVKAGVTGGLFDDVREMGRMTVQLTQNWSMWSALSQQGVEWAKGWQDYPAFKGRVAHMLSGLPIPEMPNYETTPKFKPSDVVAVVPTFNNPTMLQRCVESMIRTAPEMEIVIINNGEPLSSTPISESVKVYNMERNLGYAGAHKFAESVVTRPLILLLNDDVEAVEGSWLSFLLKELDGPQVWAVGPKLLFGDGNLQHAGGMIDFRRDDIGYHRFYGAGDTLEANTPATVDFVTGAAMLCRREFYHMPDELVDGLNMEELWMALEAKEKGFIVRYQPASVLVHWEGATKARTPDAEAKVQRNRAIFKERWLGV